VEADVSDVIERINDLKTEAKNRLDMGRLPRAVSLLQEAVALCTEEFGNASRLPEWRARIADELADCWGNLGGVERRWAFELAGDPPLRLEHLDRSIAAYDEGYHYEQMDPRRRSTYNRLNRLIVRLLRNPQILARDRDASADAGETWTSAGNWRRSPTRSADATWTIPGPRSTWRCSTCFWPGRTRQPPMPVSSG
jgi:hypothetical protein